MTDIIVVAILVVILGAAVAYIIHEKKRGKCIGCPYAKNCHACHGAETPKDKGRGGEELHACDCHAKRE